MDWWRQMFASPLWQHVQLSWEQADDADEDADRIVAALKLQRGGAVLDVPCGTGRIAKRLRSRGFPTVGVDATSTFLEEARRADVPVILADMRTGVVRPGSFAAAVCFWGSFGYFDDSGNLAQARALANALVRGGRCLIDTVAADSLLSRFEPEGSWDLGDTHVAERRRYDARSKRIDTVWTFSRGDVTQISSPVWDSRRSRRSTATSSRSPRRRSGCGSSRRRQARPRRDERVRRRYVVVAHPNENDFFVKATALFARSTIGRTPDGSTRAT
jgi:SAM-dependent methyltransferase